jgi:hypothetical protein
MRSGQRVSIYEGVVTLKGKRGTLVTRYRSEYVEGGNGYHVGIGTWKVVRGTGQYARITGGGRSGNVWLDRGPWSLRDEGFLTLPWCATRRSGTHSRAATSHKSSAAAVAVARHRCVSRTVPASYRRPTTKLTL